ncbi:MAG: DUF692 domain-containing protein [Chromatiales bacterium]|nr:DUF692 domain-containing protein [Chromatiales bacterium]
MVQSVDSITGAGLGLRRDIIQAVKNSRAEAIDFLEIAPENWIGIGGRLKAEFEQLSDRYPIFCHGLSLSLGSPAALDKKFLKQVKDFLEQYSVCYYSEHLSYCSDEGHLYDLMPIPFTPDAADYVADRICQVQDFLGQRIAIENISAYIAPAQVMRETDFINQVLEKSDCRLLLDVNNVYVNSVNFKFDPEQYLKELPAERVAYCHIAGHYNEADDLIVDTHGADIIEPVWALLSKAYKLFGTVPTLLERDFNFPNFDNLLAEVARIRTMQKDLESIEHPLNG